MWVECEACQKPYSNKYNLQKHWERQPLCREWMDLKGTDGDAVLKRYVDDAFKLPVTESERAELPHKCFSCGKDYSNAGNLNKHLDTSVVCAKWAMVRELKPLGAYFAEDMKPLEAYSDLYITDNDDNGNFCSFAAPAYRLCHIIWNVYLIDKEFPLTEEIMEENDVKYVIAILPEDAPAPTVPGGAEVHVMRYSGHTMHLDVPEFDAQCARIEEFRARRENVFVYCNTGYQRSIPFLCHYLVAHHADEVPTVERAIDIILPQVDKDQYMASRDDYIRQVSDLFQTQYSSSR